jgi:hypothetical protein
MSFQKRIISPPQVEKGKPFCCLPLKLAKTLISSKLPRHQNNHFLTSTKICQSTEIPSLPSKTPGYFSKKDWGPRNGSIKSPNLLKTQTYAQKHLTHGAPN